jgi:hypothetical protein
VWARAVETLLGGSWSNERERGKDRSGEAALPSAHRAYNAPNGPHAAPGIDPRTQREK